MIAYALPLIYTLFVWWFSTGIILYLDRRPRSMHPRIMALTSILAGLALCGISATRNDGTPWGAYAAFTCSVTIWGWQEMAFLMGFITGPRRGPCPPDARGFRRFLAAAQTICHHELALVCCLVAILAISWKGANQVGPETFLVLWIMRLSAKFNLFLGVRNRSEDFLPEHLRYLDSYFKRQSCNALFPISIGLASVVAVIGWMQVFGAQAASVESTRVNFVSALLSLAILEHWFMVVPLPTSGLWKWSMRPPRTSPTEPKPL